MPPPLRDLRCLRKIWTMSNVIFAKDMGTLTLLRAKKVHYIDSIKIKIKKKNQKTKKPKNQKTYTTNRQKNLAPKSLVSVSY